MEEARLAIKQLHAHLIKKVTELSLVPRYRSVRVWPDLYLAANDVSKNSHFKPVSGQFEGSLGTIREASATWAKPDSER